MVYIPVRPYFNRAVGKRSLPDIFRCRVSQSLSLHGHKIYQVMDMENIARGKDTFHIGLEIFIHQRSLGPAIQGYTCIQ